MDIGLTVVGGPRLRALVERAIDVAGDLTPVWVKVDRRFTQRHQQQFESDGALTGGWPALNADYLNWKSDARGVHTVYGIMVLTGRLRRSLLNPFDPDAVHRMNAHSYERGTAAVSEKGVPYPVLHQAGIGVPKRETLVWDESDADFAADALADLIGRALNG